MSVVSIISLVLLILLITLVAIMLYKNSKQQSLPAPFNIDSLKETLLRVENDVKTNFGVLTEDQKQAITKWTKALDGLDSNDKNITDLKKQLQQLMTFSDGRFNTINEKQSSNLTKLNEAFLKLEENLANIDKLKTDIQSLNKIFYNTKTRGNMGEFALNTILTNILGENNKIWTTQSKLAVEDNKSASGNIDVLINMGDKEKIAIDAKFPLTAYLAVEKALSEDADSVLVKAHKEKFQLAVSNKIKEVKKYISIKNNISHAILFIPSEAIFAYLNNEMPAIFNDAFKSRVWICSPTTLAALLHLIAQVQKDHELNKNLIKVKKIIMEIGAEYKRFDTRWAQVKKNSQANMEIISNLDITINKIQTKQQTLETFELDESN